jgi:hypothetical protein
MRENEPSLIFNTSEFVVPVLDWHVAFDSVLFNECEVTVLLLVEE